MNKPNSEEALGTILYDLAIVLEKVDPWTIENIQKAVDSYAKRYVYTLLAVVIQGKSSNYLPIAPSLEILGKDWMLKRLGWKR